MLKACVIRCHQDLMLVPTMAQHFLQHSSVQQLTPSPTAIMVAGAADSSGARYRRCVTLLELQRPLSRGGGASMVQPFPAEMHQCTDPVAVVRDSCFGTAACTAILYMRPLLDLVVQLWWHLVLGLTGIRVKDMQPRATNRNVAVAAGTLARYLGAHSNSIRGAHMPAVCYAFISGGNCN